MRRYVLIAAVAIAILIVLGGGTLLLVNKNHRVGQTIENVAKINTNINTNAATNTNTAPANTNTAAVADATAITYVARNFAEQYGTGSSDDKFAGYLAATAWTTTALTQQLRQNLLLQTTSTVYHSFVSRALVVRITRNVGPNASVTVTAQRTETNGTTSTTFNQDINITLVKTGATWQVNSATWQPR